VAERRRHLAETCGVHRGVAAQQGVDERSRHRITKFLLRRELYSPKAGKAWTQQHRDWLCSLRFADRCSQLAFADQLHAHDGLLWRRDALDRAIADIVEDSPWATVIGRLRCLRGVDTLTGGSGSDLAAGDFVRRCKQLVDLLGQVSEASSGRVHRAAQDAIERVRRGVVASS